MWGGSHFLCYSHTHCNDYRFSCENSNGLNERSMFVEIKVRMKEKNEHTQKK